jgi:hypothetical protein
MASGFRTSTIVTSEVPSKGWHELIATATHADAICDRLIQRPQAHLKGPSRPRPEDDTTTK